MKDFLIAGNWKMNKIIGEAEYFAKKLASMNLNNASEIAILAPYTDLLPLKNSLSNSGIKFGAQNCHYEKNGAYTGEISVPMLKEIGVDYCIVGHSERRQYFNETDDTVNLKIKALLENEIRPILCVGEPLDVREQHTEQTYVASQLFRDLEGIYLGELDKVIIAYEPIWAIGTGKNASPEQAEEMCAFIRGVLGGMYDIKVADSMLILYGGSMKPDNALDILAKPDVNGGLIGGASLNVEDFASIAKIASTLK